MDGRRSALDTGEKRQPYCSPRTPVRQVGKANQPEPTRSNLEQLGQLRQVDSQSRNQLIKSSYPEAYRRGEYYIDTDNHSESFQMEAFFEKPHINVLDT